MRFLSSRPKKTFSEAVKLSASARSLIHNLNSLGAGLDRLVKVADLSLDQDFAASGREISGDKLDHGGFARAIVAHEAHNLAWLDRKADIIQRVNGAKALRHTSDIK